MPDHRKIDTVILADMPPRKTLPPELQRAAAASMVRVGREAFNTAGHLHNDVLEVASEVMSHGGTVVVDLPDIARRADVFNAFALSLLNRADAKAGHRNTGQMLFEGPVDAPLVAAAKPPARRH